MSYLNGQIAIVTGANSGVGESAARRLAEAGTQLVMVCRSPERGERALAGIRALHPHATVDLEIADLSRQDDVRGLGTRLAQRFDSVDILVNNAGVWEDRLRNTADGFELSFATNHLGHFALTHLLLAALAAGRGRVVNVSSEAHRRGDLRRAPLEDVARGAAWRSGLQAYSDSKLANVLFTFEAVRRFGDMGITANALHPGVLATRIWNKSWSPISVMMRPMKLFMGSSDVGGRAIMRLVEDPDGDAVTGRYFKVEQEVQAQAPALDEELAGELWERSLEWTGVEPS